ncbi:hypothetical protein [Agrobacterium sp. RAC06]|uniref:hypothetical protein n=1 Tax=Agrobacterium sp. RAC06 TaxID=1842536 RepID=UPI00083D4CAD|nr:hypothetical protein [Agrobacterium sp. RAC06]AOG11418.1 hypothetical protein BSY240_517 [Agrobacterium sp. RAC06]
MTMVCCDTPLPRPSSRTIPRLNARTDSAGLTAAARTLDERASHAADRLATIIRTLSRALADHRRRRLDAAALEALPFDLRKDLGWPSGDTAP